MTTRVKAVIAAVALLGAYGAGRWASPTKVVTKVKTVQVVKTIDTSRSSLNRDRHVKTVVHFVRLPNGTVEKTTTITQDSQTKTKRQTADRELSVDQTDKSKHVTYAVPSLTVSLLGGVSVSTPIPTPVYGLSVSKRVIGPIGIGAWGLNNGTVGLSAGITF